MTEPVIQEQARISVAGAPTQTSPRYNTPLTLWFEQPAHQWLQALPLGNGHMGAMVWGDPRVGRIDLTELTCWSGTDDDHDPTDAGPSLLAQMRNASRAGNIVEVENLARRLNGRKGNYGTNLPLGILWLELNDIDDDVTHADYHRELDLSTGITRSRWRMGKRQFTSDSFISHPDKVLVSRMSCRDGFALRLRLDGAGNVARVQSESRGLVLQGDARETMHSDGQCGESYYAMAAVDVAGGVVRPEPDQLLIRGTQITVVVGMATTFDHTDPAASVRRTVAGALDRGYASLFHRHQADYRSMFGRVHLAVESADTSTRPTDQRIAAAQQGHMDVGLETLLFQYGRYLLLASSRSDSPLPAHLQGVWNDNRACRIGWTCDMHLDINTQMNYWPANVTNLRESHQPLLNWIRDRLVPKGRATATKVYGCQGWVAHAVSNAWGFSSPGWDTHWGIHPTGGAWIAMHLFDHWRFEGDLTFLEDAVWPVLREAAVFFLDYLYDDPATGFLLSGPSNSPENFICRNGRTHSLTMGPTCDNVILRALFHAVGTAADHLGRSDDDIVLRCAKAAAKLPPLRITGDGRLAEWMEDHEEAMPQHRHMAHLLAVYPFNEITPERTPELAQAALRTMHQRTSHQRWEDTGWARSNLLLFAARLGEHELASQHLRALIANLASPNGMIIHPPLAGADICVYELDGNTGYTAGVAEMLLQSHDGHIAILPALPTHWDTGSVQGLRARGGFTVDIAWQQRQVQTVTITADRSVLCRLQLPGNSRIDTTNLSRSAVAATGAHPNSLTLHCTAGEPITLRCVSD